MTGDKLRAMLARSPEERWAAFLAEASAEAEPRPPTRPSSCGPPLSPLELRLASVLELPLEYLSFELVCGAREPSGRYALGVACELGGGGSATLIITPRDPGSLARVLVWAPDHAVDVQRITTGTRVLFEGSASPPVVAAVKLAEPVTPWEPVMVRLHRWSAVHARVSCAAVFDR